MATPEAKPTVPTDSGVGVSDRFSQA